MAIDASHNTTDQHDVSVVEAHSSNPKKYKKRERGDDGENDGPSKIIPGESHESFSSTSCHQALPCHPNETREGKPSSDPDSADVPLKAYPYFYYRDFSDFPDPDPLVPLTSPGRVPSFPAKMHSILSRPDLADVVAWSSHGRSWKVLKPREFELKVIPTYFEHAKYSSFIRQANGWGFRRVKQGPDRNSYFHELFLRGLPHLCKMMKRPGVSKKHATDLEHEPDLFKISQEKPVPERAQDESILLYCTLQGGPKARMPVCLGKLMCRTLNLAPITGVQVPVIASSPPMASLSATQSSTAPAYPDSAHPHPHSQANSNFSPTLVPSTKDNPGINSGYMTTLLPNKLHQAQPEHTFLPRSAYKTTSQAPIQMNTFFTTAPAHENQTAISQTPTASEANSSSIVNPISFMQPGFQGSSLAAAQFAAGFAAATVLGNQNFREILGHTLASFPSTGNNGGQSTFQQLPPVQQQAPTQQYHHEAPPSQQHQGQPQQQLGPQGAIGGQVELEDPTLIDQYVPQTIP